MFCVFSEYKHGKSNSFIFPGFGLNSFVPTLAIYHNLLQVNYTLFLRVNRNLRSESMMSLAPLRDASSMHAQGGRKVLIQENFSSCYRFYL